MPIVDVEPIVDEDTLLRRIHPSQMVEDKNLGARRPSSGAFTDPELSVDSELLLAKYNLNIAFCLRDFPEYSLARFAAGFARATGMTVTHTPQADNPAHTEVIGKKTKALQRQFAAISVWAHEAPK
jgi:hypothetical protein